jgi:hypothetical protein
VNTRPVYSDVHLVIGEVIAGWIYNPWLLRARLGLQFHLSIDHGCIESPGIGIVESPGGSSHRFG